ncbi:hypothetical protein [Bacillus sp. REN16]|uniref:hypothetical protein n=1 Tax=Bacillus sp. REN16 TaxID=2887296 RepID=UPI001E5BBD17|nr:hypothetical protein [Bacillus sp. REN16]MCC3357239.1 hypothetical protein [Bacillus sp. REN16]
MGKKVIVFLFLLCSLPILLSLDPATYDSSYHAKYESPEGILFLSYSKNWNEPQLEDLYKELIKNKHAEEINLLQEVRVMAGLSPSNSMITGIYHPFISSITLYKGNEYTSASEYRDTLSHEYGHHFGYYYFPTHHFPFSKWAKLRGLDDMPVHWNAFLNYSISAHEWYPQEIFADDYVLLYGVTNEVDRDDVYTNEAFYKRIQHENQKLENVLGNKELQQFIEQETGIKIDHDRKLETPELSMVTDNSLTFTVEKKKDVAYRLNLADDELYEITDDQSGLITFSNIDLLENAVVSLDVLDLNTSIGYMTDKIRLHLEDLIEN